MRTSSTFTIVLVALAGCMVPPDDAPAASSEALTYCPGATTLEGIDVSEWQGHIDWRAVAGSGKSFAIARVSDGLHHVDPTFDGNYAGIAANGMVRGSYQFFRPLQDPVAQADLVLAHIGHLGPNDLPPMIDIESTPGDPLPSPGAFNAAIHAWVDRIQSATGRMPLIYVGSYFWDEHIATGDFGAYPLVMPAYGPVCPRIMASWDHWVMHQYSSTGSVPGIAGNVDMDAFDGDRARLNVLAGTPLCAAHCEGSVVVGADCGRGDCAAYGSRCVDDALGVRCAFYACPDRGDADVCLDASRITHCHDGLPSSPGDCSVYGSHCVSDALGGRCVFYACPATGDVDACVDSSHITHCHDGLPTPPGDCGAYGAYCSSAGADHARCVSAFCVSSPTMAPTTHDGCLPDGQLIHCHADATVMAEHCPAGQTCVLDASGDGRCAAPGSHDPDGGAASGGAGALPDAGAGTHGDGGTSPRGDGGVAHGDAGGGVGRPPVMSGGCSATGAGGGGAPVVGVLLLGLVALAARRRQSPKRALFATKKST